MVRIIACIIVLAVTVNAGSSAQALEEKEKTIIGFGKEEHRIGIDKGGGEHWKPLFFSIDTNGNIHIPDFYKARIAVFGRKGRLVEQKSCHEGISPRMNYFCLTQQGTYVTYGDYTLYLIDENGSLIWKNMLGYGVIPRFVWANEVAIFIVLPGKDERAIVFDYFSNRPIGRFGFMDEDRGIPMIMSKNKAQFTLTIHDMSKIPESGYAKDAFSLEENAFLIFIGDKERSLWKKRKGETEYIYLFSKEGKLEKEGVIHFPSTGIEGTGFWTACDNWFAVYKNYYYENHLEIVKYGFK